MTWANETKLLTLLLVSGFISQIFISIKLLITGKIWNEPGEEEYCSLEG